MVEQASDSLNVDAISNYLRPHLDGFDGAVQAVKFSNGQSNPTFLIKTAAKNYVLRRKPMGVLLKSAHAVEREYRVQKALHASDVPVADMYLLCEDDAVIGSSFYVMEHVVGTAHDDPRLLDLEKPVRAAVMDDMTRVLASLHNVDFEAVGLSSFGPDGNYYERQIGRWSKQYLTSKTQDLPEMDRLIMVLDERMPADDGVRTLVHGDYRIDNMIFSTGGAECLAVLDWELSTLGHPLADLASVIMQWQMPTGTEGRGLHGVEREASGLPSDEEFIARYCERRGLSGIDDFGFYLGFCFFRMAAVLEGVKRRAMDGNASNPERAMKLAAQVPAFAHGGLRALGESI